MGGRHRTCESQDKRSSPEHNTCLGWVGRRAKGRPGGGTGAPAPTQGPRWPAITPIVTSHGKEGPADEGHVRCVGGRALAATCTWTGEPKGVRGPTPPRTESRGSHRGCAWAPMPMAARPQPPEAGAARGPADGWWVSAWWNGVQREEGTNPQRTLPHG